MLFAPITFRILFAASVDWICLFLFNSFALLFLRCATWRGSAHASYSYWTLLGFLPSWYEMVRLRSAMLRSKCLRCFAEFLNWKKLVRCWCSLGSLNGDAFDVHHRTGELANNTSTVAKHCDIRGRCSLSYGVIQGVGPIKDSANRQATVQWTFPTIGLPDSKFWRTSEPSGTSRTTPCLYLLCLFLTSGDL